MRFDEDGNLRVFSSEWTPPADDASGGSAGEAGTELAGEGVGLGAGVGVGVGEVGVGPPTNSSRLSSYLGAATALVPCGTKSSRAEAIRVSGRGVGISRPFRRQWMRYMAMANSCLSRRWS
jgi:hypothetical protein